MMIRSSKLARKINSFVCHF